MYHDNYAKSQMRILAIQVQVHGYIINAYNHMLRISDNWYSKMRNTNRLI